MSLSRDPLNRRLAVVAAPVPLAAIAYVLPVACRAVAAAVQAGWDVTVGPEAGLGELVTDEAVRAGGRPTVVLPHKPPAGHWTRLLRAVYGEAVRWLWCDREMRDEWAGMARIHYPLALPDQIPVLATAHAALDGAALALILPPLGAPDAIVAHALWVSRLLSISTVNLATVGGLHELYREIQAEE
jgi:hypothetical protein